MNATVHVRSHTTTTHYLEIDGDEFVTEYAPCEHIEPRVVDDGQIREITYAVLDEFPPNPRDEHDTIGTMVRVRDGYDGIEIDTPDSDIAAAFAIAADLRNYARYRTSIDAYFVTLCGCCGSHEVEEVMAGECEFPYDAMLVGWEQVHYSDGSTSGLEVAFDGTDADGLAAMIDMALHQTLGVDRYALLAAFIKAARPDITGFVPWDFDGYSQSDWAQGYAYTTQTDLVDPEAALLAEVAEYAAWARGDVYGVVTETYDLSKSEDGSHRAIGGVDACWGFYGDEYAQRVVNEGGY